VAVCNCQAEPVNCPRPVAQLEADCNASTRLTLSELPPEIATASDEHSEIRNAAQSDAGCFESTQQTLSELPPEIATASDRDHKIHKKEKPSPVPAAGMPTPISAIPDARLGKSCFEPPSLN